MKYGAMALLLAALLIQSGSAEDRLVKVVRVTGTAEVKVVPDRALIEMGGGFLIHNLRLFSFRTIINDSYNSNPRALNAMIDTLTGMKASRYILVAGEMLELGATGEALHRECGRHAAEKKVDLVIGVRGLARSLAEAACGAGVQAQFVESPEEAGELLARELQAGDAVLLKASRGVKLERALEVLRMRMPAKG